MKTRDNLYYHLGNILIITALVSFTIIFYPVLSLYIFPPQFVPLKDQVQKGTFITIPKIHAQAPVIEEVNPWNETEYRKALDKGVAQAKGTSLPGQKGTIFLFAHSSGAPWEQTRFNTVFLRLGELKNGDTIIIERNGIVYLYKVYETKEVFPAEVGYLLQNQKNQLILQTCTPIGTSLKRLLVFADPKEYIKK